MNENGKLGLEAKGYTFLPTHDLNLFAQAKEGSEREKRASRNWEAAEDLQEGPRQHLGMTIGIQESKRSRRWHRIAKKTSTREAETIQEFGCPI